MKIFLANPPYRISINEETERYFVRAGSRWPFSMVKKKDRFPEYRPFPFYLAYTASLIRQAGFEVFADDGVALNETEEELFHLIDREKPDIILLETTTPTIKNDITLAKKIKEKYPNTIIVMAGAHGRCS